MKNIHKNDKKNTYITTVRTRPKYISKNKCTSMYNIVNIHSQKRLHGSAVMWLPRNWIVHESRPCRTKVFASKNIYIYTIQWFNS